MVPPIQSNSPTNAISRICTCHASWDVMSPRSAQKLPFLFWASKLSKAGYCRKVSHLLSIKNQKDGVSRSLVPEFSCSKTPIICIDTECESASRVKAKPSTAFWGLSRGLLGCCRKLWKIRLKWLNMLSWLHHIISVYIHLVHGPASWGHVSKSKFGGSCGASGLLLSLLAHRAAKS